MKNEISIKNIIFILISSLYLFSCSQKNKTIDIDLSNLPKPKNINIAEKQDKDLINPSDKAFIKDLEPYKDKKLLLTEYKIGKKDPFSKSEAQLNQFSSDFEITGFLNTNIKKYVFVSYLGNEGTISDNSIGGLNTNLLPNGARVIEIDTKKRQLKISYDNEDFIFEL